MPLNKTHKAFRLTKAMPVDANNVNIEQAFARFLVLVRTKGLPITTTSKETLYPGDLAQIIIDDTKHFQGIKDDPLRKRLIKHWIENDFATCVKEGRGRTGEGRLANLKPIHMSTIKLLDPRVRSQDRDVSGFLYNVFRDSGLIIGEQESFLPFLTQGTNDFGEYDLKLNESLADTLDVETFFLLRMLEHFRMDLADRRKRVPTHDFLCQAQKQLIINDTARLLVYKDSIPRRELINYLMVLLAFHSALYCIKSFFIINGIFENEKVGCGRCKSIKMDSLEDLCECDYQPDIFVDLTNGQDETCDFIAKEKVAKHYATMHQYLRSHYKLKKLDEFASIYPPYNYSVEELLKFLNHKDLNGHFGVLLREVVATGEGEEQDPEIKAILDLGMSPFDTYIEIINQKTFKTRSKNHKKLMADLCGLNREDGFLHGGRGKKRKYVLGNQLLELLVQLAVVDYRRGKFCTRPIVISEFVTWLKQRYGILIDTTGEVVDSPEVARALESNYAALKSRLRQLGFFTDLSDASISQVIKPRFSIDLNAV